MTVILHGKPHVFLAKVERHLNAPGPGVFRGVGDGLLANPEKVVFGHGRQATRASGDLHFSGDIGAVGELSQDAFQCAAQIAGFQHLRTHVPDGIARLGQAAAHELMRDVEMP